MRHESQRVGAERAADLGVDHQRSERRGERRRPAPGEGVAQAGQRLVATSAEGAQSFAEVFDLHR